MSVTTWVVIILAVTGAYALWVLIAPRSAWRRTMAWRFRRPADPVPGAPQLRGWRVGAAFALIAILAAGTVLARGAVQRREADERGRDVRLTWGYRPVGYLGSDRVSLVPDGLGLAAQSGEEEPPPEEDAVSVTTAPDLWMPVDDEERLPAYMWHLADGVGGRYPDGVALRSAPPEGVDLVVRYPGRVSADCPAVELAVREEADLIVVGFGRWVHLDRYGIGEPVPARCADADDGQIALVGIDLSSPVGDREVVGPDGAPVVRARESPGEGQG
ncbi:hypothetical protein ACFQ23_02470 [Schaalia naturae]|uniref:Uncharacterized protein n=1 Tax=Schaalia naturae TaxID=635203 RepID=A0ABW2SNS1_9ACTO